MNKSTSEIAKDVSTILTKTYSSEIFRFSSIENDITEFNSERVNNPNGFNEYKEVEAADETDSLIKNPLINFEEKLKFNENIRRMDGNFLSILLREFQKLCPQVIEEIDDENIQIRLDKLNSKSFEQISR